MLIPSISLFPLGVQPGVPLMTVPVTSLSTNDMEPPEDLEAPEVIEPPISEPLEVILEASPAALPAEPGPLALVGPGAVLAGEA